MDVLIAEDQLNVDELLLARLAEKVPAIRWREMDEDLRRACALRVALLDSELRCQLIVGDLPELVAFYNGYYWALIFARRYQARYGFDAGVEQQLFDVLERAPASTDWQVVERVVQAAQQACFTIELSGGSGATVEPRARGSTDGGCAACSP